MEKFSLKESRRGEIFPVDGDDFTLHCDCDIAVIGYSRDMYGDSICAVSEDGVVGITAKFDPSKESYDKVILLARMCGCKIACSSNLIQFSLYAGNDLILQTNTPNGVDKLALLNAYSALLKK